MTEQEAIKILTGIEEVRGNLPEDGNAVEDALMMARAALEEVQQYRALGAVEELAEIQNSYFTLSQKIRQYEKIGTMEELRGAIEKRVPKKPKLSRLSTRRNRFFICPNCSNHSLLKNANERCFNMFCWNCGQAIDWSEEIEP